MPEINITQIQKALDLPLTGGFISDTLGVKPARTDKRAMFWNADQYEAICNALDLHVAAGRANDPLTFSGVRKDAAKAPATAAATDTGAQTTHSAAADDSSDFFGSQEPETADDLFG